MAPWLVVHAFSATWQLAQVVGCRFLESFVPLSPGKRRLAHIAAQPVAPTRGSQHATRARPSVALQLLRALRPALRSSHSARALCGSANPTPLQVGRECFKQQSAI
jgi:hypothetical protein